MNVIIPSAPKDYTKLPYVIKNIAANVCPKVENIYIFTPTKLDLKINDLNIINILENDVIKYDKYRIKYRPTWQYAMYLKLFQDVTEGNEYLVMDSDHILIKNFNLYDKDNKPYFFLTADQNAQEYFNFSKSVFNIGREYNFSFISEIMLINKNVVENMLTSINCNRDNFFYKFENYISRQCHLAEYELYGNYVYKNFPDMYSFKNINQKRISYRWHPYETDELESLISQFYSQNYENIDSIRIDTYDPP
jgi:hypothetical protein